MEPTQTESRSSNKVPFIIGGVIVIALLILGYFAFIDPYHSRSIQMKFLDITAPLPEELVGSTMLFSAANGGGLYSSERGFDFSFYTEKNIVIVDVAQSGEHQAVIGFNYDSEHFEVFLDKTLISSSPLLKQKVAISPDGTSVLFAETSGRVSDEDIYEDLWDIILIDEQGEHTVLDKGFAGIFIDDSIITIFASEIITTKDLVLGEDIGQLGIGPITGNFSLTQSSDRSLLAWREADDVFVNVYTVIGTQPLTVSRLALVEIEEVGNLLLTNSALYVTSIHQGSPSRIWQHLFEDTEAQLIRTMPDKLFVKKIIP